MVRVYPRALRVPSLGDPRMSPQPAHKAGKSCTTYPSCGSALFPSRASAQLLSPHTHSSGFLCGMHEDVSLTEKPTEDDELWEC